MTRLPKDGIVLRSILITLLAFFGASLGSIVYTANETGRRATQLIDGRLNQMLETVHSTIRIACFVNDKDLAKEVTAGLLVNAEILSATILGEDGAILAEASRKEASVGRTNNERNRLTRKIVSPFNPDKVVGEVSLVPNPAAIESIRDESVVLAAKQVMWQLLFVSVVIVSALIFFIVRPISRMSLALNQLDPVAGDRLAIPPGHGNTEIGQLVRNVNHLSEHLVAAIDEARDARIAAEAASTAKSAFLANMSHEIRTPLNAVLGFARIGMRENAGRVAGTTCQRILASGNHLLGVINDILDFSKIEAGKLPFHMETMRLSKLIAEAVDLVADRAVEKGLVLTKQSSPDLPEWVTGDAMRIQQILVNLLGNAIKFAAQGGVDLSVRHKGDDILFSVRDEGIGMTGEEISRLFQPFEQADSSTTRRFGGTGLGLAISKNLAGLMNGDIQVDSKPGQGSTFTLRLPLPEAPAPAAEDTTQPHAIDQRQDLTGLRVLAVEDIEVNRLVLEDILNEAGAGCVFAENGRLAVEQVEADPGAFDVILMDIQMPEMGGYEATRLIQAIAADLPIIGLTAHALNEEREKCLAVGMVDHVTKPIDPARLIAAITRWVRPNNLVAGGTASDDALAPSLALPPAVPGSLAIDWLVLNPRHKGKRELIKKILQAARTAYADTPAKLRQLVAAEDFAGLAFLAHNIKGMSGNIAATAIQKQAAALEIAAKAQETQGLRLAGNLAAAFQGLLEELDADLARGGGVAESGPSEIKA
jgi:signal transduction histidine kinase/CheY-like chemotaxis protein/HPt (histidine-containing phosphotransfer) domain-containing protein